MLPRPASLGTRQVTSPTLSASFAARPRWTLHTHETTCSGGRVPGSDGRSPGGERRRGAHHEPERHARQENIPYAAKNATVPNYGTDIAFARLGGRQYALAGTYRNGLQIVDDEVKDNGKVPDGAQHTLGRAQQDLEESTP
jgi:hypothetical protein